MKMIITENPLKIKNGVVTDLICDEHPDKVLCCESKIIPFLKKLCENFHSQLAPPNIEYLVIDNKDLIFIKRDVLRKTKFWIIKDGVQTEINVCEFCPNLNSKLQFKCSLLDDDCIKFFKRN